ncbi:hypothetical protein JHK82_024221 [Glycine max]|nr:hypothetical protein JHK82_024221 [Glycine max]
MSPPPHLRRSHPQDPAAMPLPVVVPFDLLPPPQVMKEKLASQNAEMQCLETENQRLAATHSVMRQELAVAQHEMQMLHGHVVALKRKREQQIRAQLEKIVKMESEAQGSESVKIELQLHSGQRYFTHFSVGVPFPNVSLTQKEIAAIMDDFNKPGSLAPIGLYLGGTKYMVIQGESGIVIRGKKV